MKPLITLLFSCLVIIGYAQNPNNTTFTSLMKYQISVGPNYSKYLTFEDPDQSEYTFNLTPGTGYSVEVGYTGFKIARIPIKISTGINNFRGNISVKYMTSVWYEPYIDVESEINQTNFLLAIDPLWISRRGFDLTFGMIGDITISDAGKASHVTTNVYRFMGQWSSDKTTDEIKINKDATLGLRFSISEDFSVSPHLTMAPRIAVTYTLTSPFYNTFDAKIYRLSPSLDIVFKLKP